MGLIALHVKSTDFLLFVPLRGNAIFFRISGFSLHPLIKDLFTAFWHESQNVKAYVNATVWKPFIKHLGIPVLKLKFIF